MTVNLFRFLKKLVPVGFVLAFSLGFAFSVQSGFNPQKNLDGGVFSSDFDSDNYWGRIFSSNKSNKEKDRIAAYHKWWESIRSTDADTLYYTGQKHVFEDPWWKPGSYDMSNGRGTAYMPLDVAFATPDRTRSQIRGRYVCESQSCWTLISPGQEKVAQLRKMIESASPRWKGTDTLGYKNNKWAKENAKYSNWLKEGMDDLYHARSINYRNWRQPNVVVFGDDHQVKRAFIIRKDGRVSSWGVDPALKSYQTGYYNNKYFSEQDSIGIDFKHRHWRHSWYIAKDNEVILYRRSILNGPGIDYAIEHPNRFRYSSDGNSIHWVSVKTLSQEDLTATKRLWTSLFTDAKEAGENYESNGHRFNWALVNNRYDWRLYKGEVSDKLRFASLEDQWTKATKQALNREPTKAERYYLQQLANHRKIAREGYLGAPDFPDGLNLWLLDPSRELRAETPFNVTDEDRNKRGSRGHYRTNQWPVWGKASPKTKALFVDKMQGHRYELAQLLRAQNAFSDFLQLSVDGATRNPLESIRDLQLVGINDYSRLLKSYGGGTLLIPTYTLGKQDGIESKLKVTPRLFHFSGVEIDQEKIDGFERGLKTVGAKEFEDNLWKAFSAFRDYIVLKQGLYISDFEIFSAFLNAMRFQVQIAVAQVRAGLLPLKNRNLNSLPILANYPIFHKNRDTLVRINFLNLLNNPVSPSFQLFPYVKDGKQTVWKGTKSWPAILKRIRELGAVYRKHGTKNLATKVITRAKTLQNKWKEVHRFFQAVKNWTSWDRTLTIGDKTYDFGLMSEFSSRFRIEDLVYDNGLQTFVNSFVANKVSFQQMQRAFWWKMLTTTQLRGHSRSLFDGRSILDALSKNKETKLLLNGQLHSLQHLVNEKDRSLSQLSRQALVELDHLASINVTSERLLMAVVESRQHLTKRVALLPTLVSFRQIVPKLTFISIGSHKQIVKNLLDENNLPFHRLSVSAREELRGLSSFKNSQIITAFAKARERFLNRFWQTTATYLRSSIFPFAKVEIGGRVYATTTLFANKKINKFKHLDILAKTTIQELVSAGVATATLQTAFENEKAKHIGKWKTIQAYLYHNYYGFAIPQVKDGKTYRTDQLFAHKQFANWEKLSLPAKHQLQLIVTDNVDLVAIVEKLEMARLERFWTKVQPVLINRQYTTGLFTNLVFVNGKALLLNHLFANKAVKTATSLTTEAKIQLQSLLQAKATVSVLEDAIALTWQKATARDVRSQTDEILIKAIKLNQKWMAIRFTFQSWKQSTLTALTINGKSYALTDLFASRDALVLGSDLNKDARAQLQRLVDDRITPEIFQVALNQHALTHQNESLSFVSPFGGKTPLPSKTEQSSLQKVDRFDKVWTIVAWTLFATGSTGAILFLARGLKKQFTANKTLSTL